MFRYIAFVCDSRSPAQCDVMRALKRHLSQSATPWRTVLTAPEVHVVCAEERPQSVGCAALAGGRGVVLGTIFSRTTSSASSPITRLLSFGPDESAQIVASAGRHLVRSFWGNYVAILRDSARDCVLVVCSPFSTLPCLTAEFQGVRFYFSYMPDALSLGLPSFSINWRNVAALLMKEMPTGETGINEVTEVLRGECVELRQNQVAREMYWDPYHFAAEESREKAEDLAIELRETTRGCAAAWAGGHSSILHHLSGGLDSSILVSCLRDAPSRPLVTCINRHSEGGDSDERHYARLAAERAGCRLVELRRDPRVDFADVLQSAVAVSEGPQTYTDGLEARLTDREILRETGATAVITGIGGDEIFCANCAELSVADYIYSHGFGSKLPAAIISAARIQGYSVWKVLKEAVHKGLLDRTWDPIEIAFSYHTMINREVVESLLQRRHLPPSRSPRVAPGKRYQISMVMRPYGYYPALETSGPEIVSPLLSQPLVELALRIPTYVLTTDGWDRALARRAFAVDVPPEIIRRRTKGGMGEHAWAVLSRNLTYARELLLNGILVREGLLDRAKVADALSGRPSGAMKGMAKIYQYISIEIWLQIWARQNKRMAA